MSNSSSNMVVSINGDDLGVPQFMETLVADFFFLGAGMRWESSDFSIPFSRWFQVDE